MERGSRFYEDEYYISKANPEHLLVTHARRAIGLPVNLKVLYRDFRRNGTVCEFYFEDKIWIGFIGEGNSMLSLEITEKTIPRCMSCGKESLCIVSGHLKQCANTKNKFWEKVRRLYWHRHIKNK